MQGREKTLAFLPPVCCVPVCSVAPKDWGRERFGASALWLGSLFLIYLLRLSVFICSLKLIFIL